MTCRSLTQAEIKRRLRYDPSTGEFTHLTKLGGVKKGSQAGTVRADGYVQIKIGGRFYLAHRLAWLYIYGAWPVEHVDHINGQRGDNRLSNLREASHAQNQRNCGKQANNTSGFKGVTFNKRNGKWQAQTRFEGASKHLGLFETPEQAFDAYCRAVKKLHGDFFNDGL